MFVKDAKRSMTCAGEQRVRGYFLALVCNKEAPFHAAQIRAVVRYVRLRQCGHFMMGKMRVGRHSLTVSGSYGGDGLPMRVPSDVYATCVELPWELVEAWNKGDGWNSAGTEAPLMRKWALDNLAALRKAGSRCD